MFLKAKYREILSKEVEQVPCEDLLSNPEPVNIEELVQLFKNKVHDISRAFPTLGSTIRNTLTRDLEESINRTLLKDLISTYKSKITILRHRGILEEDEMM